VPYPFQNNIRYLPETARNQCIDGLINLSVNPAMATNFREWMDEVFGVGIVKYFMAPYNFKVWATPPELMSKDWIAERVSVVDLARIEKNIAEQRDDVGWGPNNLFKFPRKGGTGAIYTAISSPFRDKIRFGHELTQLDLKNKWAIFSNGVESQYDRLISTIPLDRLVEKCLEVPDQVRAAAAQLVHNSVFVVGIGLRKKSNDSRCWMYFPEENCPFYRVTNFHNYSPYNVPNGDIKTYSALMCETSYSSQKPVAAETIVEETIRGLINTGLLAEEDRDKIVSRYLLDVPYAYPVPTVGRDAALAVIQPFLEGQGVYSRGRFGAWKYEIGNMDHSFMQGVEIAERLVSGGEEKVFHGF
jgi:protoporphyrinogen oxidase